MPRDEAFRVMRAAFGDAGLDTPDLDARRLLEVVAGVDLAAFAGKPKAPIGAASGALNAAILRRLAREPVSRIAGVRAFYKSTFLVTPATLDPRPETETLVEAALEILHPIAQTGHALRLLDLGTGTGCILLSLLAELPHATGVGIDISQEALDVAVANATRLGLAARAEWKCVSIAETPESLRSVGMVDAIVSNPPYILTGEVDRLEPEVRWFDPRIALDGGPDGLAAYRQIAKAAPECMSDGWLLVEVGRGQERDVSALFSDVSGCSDIRAWRDLAGVTRCVAGRIRRLP